MNFFLAFDFQQLFTVFFVLFAAIDSVGAIPTILTLRRKGKTVSAKWGSIYSTIMLFGFFYIGEAFLSLFHLDISSFAIAGSLVIFMFGMEMILDVEIFKSNGPNNQQDATFMPVVFPLLTGAGVLTTMMSIRSQYADINMHLAMALNVGVIFLVLKFAHVIEKWLGKNAIYMMQKFFGIILVAMAVKLFITNVTLIIQSVGQ